LKRVIVFLTTALLILSGCSKSPEEATNALKEAGYEINAQGINSAIEKKDYDAIEWFSIAGMDKEQLRAGLYRAVENPDPKALEILLASRTVQDWAETQMEGDLAQDRIERQTTGRIIYREYERAAYDAVREAHSEEEKKSSLELVDVFLDQGIVPHKAVVESISNHFGLFRKLYGEAEDYLKPGDVWLLAARGSMERACKSICVNSHLRFSPAFDPETRS